MAGKLKVIPVIDILSGRVVHAVRGKRSEYRPLKSVLCSSFDPVEVANAFKRLGFNELYIADLDAIIDCSTDFHVPKLIANETALKFMVDAGVSNMDRAQKLLESGAQKLVIGTETLQTKSFIDEAVVAYGSDRIIVSLDLKGGKVLAKQGFDGSPDPLRLLGEFQDMGVSQFIVLDLTRVGSSEGVNIDFLKKALDDLTLDVYVGGGVRNISDLVELKNLGVKGVLVATALHTGAISVQDLRRAGLL